MQKVAYFDNSNIENCIWPETFLGQRAKDYLLPLVKGDLGNYIDNISSQLAILKVGNEVVLPIVINHGDDHLCSLSSPYSHYVSYGMEMIERHHINKWLSNPITAMLKMLGKGFHWGEIDKVIYVDNWLFPTAIHPHLTKEAIHAIQSFLVKTFPDHAIAFRSIYNSENDPLFNGLKDEGFKMIACRKAYILDARKEDPFNTRIFKSDLKLLEKTPYEVVRSDQIKEEEIPRIAELYRSLYLDKHSINNVHLTEEFFAHAIKNNTLSMLFLKKNERIDAFAGYYIQDGMMISPVLGYDIKEPKEAGLYRKIHTLLALEAKKNKVIFNQSAGAATFKTIRRASSQIEFLAVYAKHLSFRRGLPWQLLYLAMNGIGLHVLNRLEGI